jgi:replicative DNA helicase
MGATAAGDRYCLRSEPEAERTVIGALLLAEMNGDRQCAATVFGRLQAADFREAHWRTIFDAMERIYRDGRPLEHALLVAALKPEMENPAGALYEAADNVATTAHVAHYVRLVSEASRQRRAVCVVNDALNGLRNCNGNIGEVSARYGQSWPTSSAAAAAARN